MNNSKLKRNFIKKLTIFTLLCGGVGALILHFVLQENFIIWYSSIPIFFFVLGIVSIYVFEACIKRTPQKIGLLYLAIKVLKLIVSILFMIVYSLVVKEHVKDFILTFVVFYFLYLIFETWFFFSFEKMNKNKNKQENETVA